MLYSAGIRSDLGPNPRFARGWVGMKVWEEMRMAFVRAAAVGEIPAGTIREGDGAGKALGVANVGGGFHAIVNTCIHRGGPLGGGALGSKTGTCPWAAWQF